jgi:hypothetical protein
MHEECNAIPFGKSIYATDLDQKTIYQSRGSSVFLKHDRRADT